MILEKVEPRVPSAFSTCSLGIGGNIDATVESGIREQRETFTPQSCAELSKAYMDIYVEFLIGAGSGVLTRLD